MSDCERRLGMFLSPASDNLRVTKRKISGGTRSDDGRGCSDAFVGLAKTSAKLGITLWDYLGSRLAVPGQPIIPPLTSSDAAVNALNRIGPVSMVLDNASYNHTKEIRAYLEQPECRIRLVYLPAYAPNLNLIERLWWLMKKKALHNQYFPRLADFKAAIDGFFDNISRYHAEIASLITGAFRFIGASNPRAP